MTAQTISGMKVSSLENMTEDIIPQRQVFTIFTLTFTNKLIFGENLWKEEASGRTNERRSCSPYGFDRLQRNPEDHPL